MSARHGAIKGRRGQGKIQGFGTLKEGFLGQDTRVLNRACVIIRDPGYVAAALHHEGKGR